MSNLAPLKPTNSACFCVLVGGRHADDSQQDNICRIKYTYLYWRSSGFTFWCPGAGLQRMLDPIMGLCVCMSTEKICSFDVHRYCGPSLFCVCACSCCRFVAVIDCTVKPNGCLANRKERRSAYERKPLHPDRMQRVCVCDEKLCRKTISPLDVILVKFLNS